MLIMADKPELKDFNNFMDNISNKLDDISISLEKTGIAEYVDMIHNPRRLLYINFWTGVVRGFGMAIGFTLLAALVIYILQKLLLINMPLIGDFIADIINIVQNRLYTDVFLVIH